MHCTALKRVAKVHVSECPATDIAQAGHCSFLGHKSCLNQARRIKTASSLFDSLLTRQHGLVTSESMQQQNLRAFACDSHCLRLVATLQETRCISELFVAHRKPSSFKTRCCNACMCIRCNVCDLRWQASSFHTNWTQCLLQDLGAICDSVPLGTRTIYTPGLVAERFAIKPRTSTRSNCCKRFASI